MGQYFSNDYVKSEISEYSVIICDERFSFCTDNGVFSKGKLDFGTRVLLENLPIADFSGSVLDIGCGYGVISIVLAKLTECNVLGVDVNKRALHLAEMNAKKNKIENVSFLESNCYEMIPQDKKYHYIVTNPPIRAGKKIVYEILMRAKDFLLDNGALFLVIRKEQGAKSVLRDLEEIYDVTVLEKKNGFFVIRCDLR